MTAGFRCSVCENDNYLEILDQAYAQHETRITEIANQQIQTRYTIIGYFVDKCWKRPSDICEAIADHHKNNRVFLQDNSSDSIKTPLTILKIAGHFCAI